MTTRVLVVDDSLVVRRIIVQALEGLDDITVAGQAADGKAALDQIETLSPDLVTLDIEMPVMDGIEAMRHIKARWPRLPVVMFSTLTERGAAMTLEALMAGARDYVTKPTNSTSLADSLHQVRSELGDRIRALAPPRRSVPAPAATVVPPSVSASPTASPVQRPAARFTTSTPTSSTFPHLPASTSTDRSPHLRPTRLNAIVIGASTGGPDALARVLSALPADLPVPVLVVQHMPPVFTATFAARLDSTCAAHVVEAQDGEPIQPGTVYLAPGDFHMEVTPGSQPTIRLQQGEPENFCRPAVDVLFRSAAATYGRAVLGVVLTGMGSDGARGSRALVDAGAEVYAQDEATSVVWGMPRAVTEADLAAKVLPIDHVAPALLSRLHGWEHQ